MLWVVEGGWVVAWVMVVRRVGCGVGGGVGGVLVSFEISQGSYLDMAGQDLKGDQSPGRASGRTYGLEQGLPGIKAPFFLHGRVVGGFFAWVFVGWVVVGWSWWVGMVVGWVVLRWGWWGGVGMVVGWVDDGLLLMGWVVVGWLEGSLGG